MFDPRAGVEGGYHRSVPTKNPPRLDRVSWTILASLLVLEIAVGIWPLAGTAVTWLPELALPTALGLPFLWPPLRVVPLGATTWGFWAADTVAAVVMLVVAWAMLRRAHQRRPRGRAFLRGWWTTIVAMVAANLVRAVYASFVVNADLGTYIATVAAGIVFSALLGAIVGLLVGVAASVAAATGRRALVPQEA